MTRAALKQKHLTNLALQQKQESIKTEVNNNNNFESDSKLEKQNGEGENACDTGRVLIANFIDD